jgi:hypothetical protein
MRADRAMPNIFFLGTESLKLGAEIKKRPERQDQYRREEQVQKKSS